MAVGAKCTAAHFMKKAQVAYDGIIIYPLFDVDQTIEFLRFKIILMCFSKSVVNVSPDLYLRRGRSDHRKYSSKYCYQIYQCSHGHLVGAP